MCDVNKTKTHFESTGVKKVRFSMNEFKDCHIIVGGCFDTVSNIF